MPRNLKIDIDDLIFAMQNHDTWFDQYLDLKTGKIIADDEESYEDPEEEFDKNDPDRYLSIEPYPSNEGFRMMEEFIEGVENLKARENLFKAISGARPFRNFRDALLEYPEIRDAWYKFEEERMKQYALEWLRDNDIEPEAGNEIS